MSEKIDRWDIAEGIEDGLVYRPDTGSLVEYADHAARMEAAQATIAEQAKMIEHLRGGPTPLYTAVDMANAARDGFRDGAASVVVELPQRLTYDGRMVVVDKDGEFLEYCDVIGAIKAAGGRVNDE